MQKSVVLAAVSALIAAGSACAAVVTTTGSGAFSAFPGYGYRYTASWEATAGDFSVQFFNYSGVNRFVQVGAWISPTSTALLDVPALDFTSSVVIEFINLSTGAPALPVQLTGLLSQHIGEAYSNNQQAVGEGEIRFSEALVQPATRLTNAAGASVLGASFPQTANNVLRWDATLHFVAGNFLQPSPDPSCASISCMVPDHDALRFGQFSFSYTAATGVIPEPSSWWMLCAGLALVAVKRRTVTASNGGNGRSDGAMCGGILSQRD